MFSSKRKFVTAAGIALALTASSCSQQSSDSSDKDPLPSLLQNVGSETVVDASDCPLVNPVAVEEILAEDYPEAELRFFASTSGVAPEGDGGQTPPYPVVYCWWTERGSTPTREAGPDRPPLLYVAAIGSDQKGFFEVFNEALPGSIEAGSDLPIRDPLFQAEVVDGFNAVVFVAATFPTEEGFLDEVLEEAKKPLGF